MTAARTGAARARRGARHLGTAPTGPAPLPPSGPRPGGRGVPRPATTAGAAATVRAWTELLRLPAVLTVPGDVLAGAVAAGTRPGRRTAWAVGASVCLYEAGMVLNDWADRDEDAVARPHRPLPSGRVRPRTALAAAGTLTAAGLALSAHAGRRAFAVAVPLAATVWAYDLKLKATAAGPAAMAAARSLDLLLGAATGPGPLSEALPAAAALGTHTGAVTLVSRHETEGGSATGPLLALATAAALTAAVAHRADPAAAAGATEATRHPATRGALRLAPAGAVRAALAASYAGTFTRPLAHAVLNPSPPLTQRAVDGGIRATIALQGALMARAGAPGTGLLTAALAPVAARLARRVSTT